MNAPIPEYTHKSHSELESSQNNLTCKTRATSSQDKEELATLALSVSQAVRCEVAKNPYTSLDTLQLLARDSHPEVRAAVATNPCTPHPALAKLALDEAGSVRFAVAQSVFTNIELLRELALDQDHEVRSAARRTYKQVTEEILRQEQRSQGESKPQDKLIA